MTGEEEAFSKLVTRAQQCEWCKKGKHWRCLKRISETKCCCNGEPSLQSLDFKFNVDKWKRFRATAEERNVGLGTALDEAIQRWMEAESKLDRHKCLRCGFEWPEAGSPRQCPKCMSPDWGGQRSLA